MTTPGDKELTLQSPEIQKYLDYITYAYGVKEIVSNSNQLPMIKVNILEKYLPFKIWNKGKIKIISILGSFL